MTLNANDVRDEYTANSGQTVFNYTFKIYDSTDLDVYVTPVGQECSDSDLTTAYTVTGVGEENGGTITLVTPTTSGDLVTIVSDIPTSRTTDYQNNGDFKPDIVNDDFDRVVSLVKQALDEANRSLQFPACQQGVTSLSLPAPVSRNYLRWKDDLSGLENQTIGNSGLTLGNTYATYDDVRAIDSSTLNDGDYLWVEGFPDPYQVRTGTVTDNGGALLVFNDDANRYAQSSKRGSGEYFITEFGDDFDTAWNNLIPYLRTIENSGASAGGLIRLDHKTHTTNGELNLYNDMRVEGYNFASRVSLADGANANIIQFAETNKTRTSYDRFWLDGNEENQTGNYRGFDDGGFEAYTWGWGDLFTIDCGGAGFWVTNGTSCQFNKLDATFCGSGGTEPGSVMQEQTIADEISITGVDDTEYTIIGVSLGGGSMIQHVHFENTRHMEYRGNGTTVAHVFSNGECTCIFQGSGNKLENADNTDFSLSLRINIQDNGTHNEVPFNSVWNNHNTLRVLHPGDGVNPYFLQAEDYWTGVARVRPSQAVGTDTINIPVPVAMQPNGTTASKSIPVLADTEYVTETFYVATNDGNTVDISVNDGTSDVLDATGLEGYEDSKKWKKYIGVARMGGSATSATYSIDSSGTNEDGYANAFTGARLTQSEMINGSMEGGFTAGVADGWTTSGTGTFTQETGAANVRTGSNSQKIVVTSGNEARFTSGDMTTLRSGVNYVVGGFIKIESTDNNKPVKLWYNTANERYSQLMCAQTKLQNPNTDWQAFQFIIDYDDQGGATNSIVIEVRGATTLYVDDVYCIPLVREGLESPTRMCLQTPLDLSGSVDTRWVHAAAERTALYLSHMNVSYTEASSADAGIDIEVGKYRTGDLDTDFFGTYTTETSQSQYNTVQSHFTRHMARDESNIAIRNNGGKTGAGEVIVEVVACSL